MCGLLRQIVAYLTEIKCGLVEKIAQFSLKNKQLYQKLPLLEQLIISSELNGKRF